jgi:2-polyprenyl-3-methyl-5-hydroxy-6-metoxy-1,4-benzoquinol methylase
MLSQLKKVIFNFIWKVYVWSSTESTKNWLSERIVEYPFVISNLDLPTGSKALLVGCAGDPLSTILPALGYNVVGIDVKFVPIKYSKFEFEQMDVRRMGFPNEYFEGVVAVSTLEHVGMMSNDALGDTKALNEIHRVLKKRGIFIMTAPYGKWPKDRRFERLYDYESIGKLLRKFSVEKLEIYKRDSDGYWSPVPEQNVNAKDKAVALVKARKLGE